MTRSVEPTPEDWENVRRSLENPRESMMEILVRNEARRRVERERHERRRRFLRRLLLLER
jgi:hypothetical protein